MNKFDIIEQILKHLELWDIRNHDPPEIEAVYIPEFTCVEDSDYVNSGSQNQYFFSLRDCEKIISTSLFPKTLKRLGILETEGELIFSRSLIEIMTFYNRVVFYIKKPRGGLNMPPPLGEKIRILRQEKGLSQIMLEKKSGVNALKKPVKIGKNQKEYRFLEDLDLLDYPTT